MERGGLKTSPCSSTKMLAMAGLAPIRTCTALGMELTFPVQDLPLANSPKYLTCSFFPRTRDHQNAYLTDIPLNKKGKGWFQQMNWGLLVMQD